jgi:FkbM family methyltransferase
MNNLGLIRHKLLYGLIESKAFKTTRLGCPCAWDFYLDGLNSRSVVISAGAGGDISFEIELHKATGASVLLLDPSPTGRKTVENTPPDQLVGIKYLPYGLTAKSGTKTFALPANPVEGSYAFDAGERETVSFECRSLEDLMKENGFEKIDLLKMDIEGFEWEVLRSILDQRLPVSQIGVEFHPMHGRLRSGLQRYLTLIEMRAKGYCLINHQGTGDHTFLKKRAVAEA